MRRGLQAKLYGALGLVVVAVTPATGRERRVDDDARPRTATRTEPVLRTIGTIQNADGLTEHQMDATFLSKLEAYTVERVWVNTRRSLINRGVVAQVSRPNSSSVYVLAGGQKFAVVRTQARDGSEVVHSLFLLGVFGKEVRRVSCVSAGHEIALTFGACADKIKEVFGRRI